MELFAIIANSFQLVNYFHKKLHLNSLTEFLNIAPKKVGYEIDAPRILACYNGFNSTNFSL